MFNTTSLKQGLGQISAKTLSLRGKSYVLNRNEKTIKFSAAFTHDPLSGPKSFRLLRIQPGAETGVVSVELYEASLDDKPEFEALSYTWDLDPKFSLTKLDLVADEKREERPILCNGKTLHITMNLYHALIEFRRRGLKLPIWADQICINQQDNKEKVAQLAIMTQIYELASTVVVWLGTLGPLQGWTLDFVESLPDQPYPVVRDIPTQAVGTTTVLGSMKSSLNIVKSLSNSVADGTRWTAVLEFVFGRQWFHRVWTLQEFLLSTRFKILMGSREISQSAIIKAAAQSAAFFDTDAFSVHLGLNLDAIPWKHLIKQRVKLFSEREEYKNGKRYTAEEYILLVRNRRATMAKDKFFAGVALLEGGALQTAHYSSTTQDIYRAFASERLWPELGVDSLSLVGGRVSSIEGLPSWVPDLSTTLQPKPLGHCGRSASHPVEALGQHEQTDFRIEGVNLHLKGVKVGSVSQIGETTWSWVIEATSKAYNAPPVTTWDPDEPTGRMVTSTSAGQERFGMMFALLDELGHTYQPTGEPILDAFWQTLTGGKTSTSHEAPAIWRNRFHHFLAFRYLVRKSDLYGQMSSSKPKPWIVAQIQDLPLMEQRFAKFLEKYDVPDIATDGQLGGLVPSPTIKKIIVFLANRIWGADSEEQAAGLGDILGEFLAMGRGEEFYKLVSEFGDLFGTVYDGRRIFLTTEGYLGISSEGVRVGDEVYSMNGAHMPYALREVDGEKGVFTLVGEAYLHGARQEDEESMSDVRIV